MSQHDGSIPNPLETPDDKQSSDFLNHANKQIKEYRRLVNLAKDGEVRPADLNAALANYTNILLALIQEYQKAKLAEYRIERQFEQWYDERFAEARAALSQDTPPSVQPAVKSIENKIRVDNADTYDEWKTAVAYAEFRTSYAKRLVDSMDKFDRILTTLSQNMRSEMKSLSLDSRMNANPHVANNNKVRRHPIPSTSS